MGRWWLLVCAWKITFLSSQLIQKAARTLLTLYVQHTESTSSIVANTSVCLTHRLLAWASSLTISTSTLPTTSSPALLPLPPHQHSSHYVLTSTPPTTSSPALFPLRPHQLTSHYILTSTLPTTSSPAHLPLHPHQHSSHSLTCVLPTPPISGPTHLFNKRGQEPIHLCVGHQPTLANPF